MSMDDNNDVDDVEGKIFIGGLSWQTTEAALRVHFEKYGELDDVALMVDKRTGQPRGFGFIKMKYPTAADIVVQQEHVIDGRKVDVKKAVPRDKAPAPTRTESKKIFVGGLSAEVTDVVFNEYFSQFGSVKDAVVMVDRTTGRSRGFGFVTFECDADVDKVLTTENSIMGKWVEVKRAEPRDMKGYENTQGNGNGGGNGGGGPRTNGGLAPPGAQGNYNRNNSRGPGNDNRNNQGQRGGGGGYPNGRMPMMPEDYPPYGAMYMGGMPPARGGYGQRGGYGGYPPGYGPGPGYGMPGAMGYGGYPGGGYPSYGPGPAYGGPPPYGSRGPAHDGGEPVSGAPLGGSAGYGGAGAGPPGAPTGGAGGGYDGYGRGPQQYPYGSSALAGYGGAYGYTGAYAGSPPSTGGGMHHAGRGGAPEAYGDAPGYGGYKQPNRNDRVYKPY